MVDANRIDKMLGSDSEDDDDAEDDADSDDGSMGQGSTYTRDLTTKSGKSGGKSTVGKSIKSHAKKSVAAKSTTASMKGVERDWLGNPVASRRGSVMGQTINVSALPKEDPRLMARPKATKAMDVVTTPPLHSPPPPPPTILYVAQSLDINTTIVPCPCLS